MKSRGTAHSRQVRELVLSSDGIALRDVFTAGGEVLMGTARYEREAEEAARREEGRHAAEQRRRELEQEIAADESRLAAARGELAGLERLSAQREERWAARDAGIRRERRSGEA